MAGKECQESSSQLLSCQYKVGSDLLISIDGIGGLGTGISFLKSDSYGDFYAVYGVMHGCVIVKSGRKRYENNFYDNFLDYAFISPKNGKVYESWMSCQDGF